MDEKQQTYFKAPSGGPLVQHSLVAMLEFYHQKKITLEKIAEKMSHAVADCFRVKERGYIREGYWADLTLVDIKRSWKVKQRSLFYKCGWSPFEEVVFKSSVTHTFVNGHLAFSNGEFDETEKGRRILFEKTN
jgi:dihydroorotase